MTQLSRRVISPITRAGLVVGGGVALAVLGEVATYPLWREGCLTWGATTDEAGATLPGDDLLADPDIVSTRAVGIDAPPSVVWPWLAQMGSGRGGVYTYDWIENLMGLHMHSVDVVLAQFQDIKVGDAQRLGKNGPNPRVVICEVDETLVLQSDDGNWVWAFVIRANGNGNRLISRNRIKILGASARTRFVYKYLMEPGSLVMERKMLMGIGERAERLNTSTAANSRSQIAPT